MNLYMNIMIKISVIIKTFLIFLSIMLLSNSFSIKISEKKLTDFLLLQNDIQTTSITDLSKVLDGDANIIGNNLSFKDTPEEIIFEGTGEIIITGESYPSNIQLAGYNSRDNVLFINFTLETIKTVNEDQRATFSYYIEVFNSSSMMIGNLGTLESPIMSIGNLGSKITVVNDKKIILSNSLTEEHRVVINVVSASVSN